MTNQERSDLAERIRAARLERGMSARELARRAGLDSATVSLLERGMSPSPQIDSVRAIAQALQIPLPDIYTLLHWLPPEELPTLRPYMRAKYRDLSETEVEQVEAFIKKLARNHKGPRPHEDE